MRLIAIFLRRLPSLLLIGLLSSLTSYAAGAQDSVVNLQTIASEIDSTVLNLAAILEDLSLIAGIGFVMASFFKFHQHKLNPTQIPMSQGITLLLIGAGLTLFPILLPTAGSAILGTHASIAHVGGSEIKNLIGSS